MAGIPYFRSTCSYPRLLQLALVHFFLAAVQALGDGALVRVPQLRRRDPLGLDLGGPSFGILRATPDDLTPLALVALAVWAFDVAF